MASTTASQNNIPVTIEIPYQHPLLKLKRGLDWPLIEHTLKEPWLKAGKQVKGGRGRKFDLAFYARLIVLMIYLQLDSRGMEKQLKENAAVRLFVQVDRPTEGLVRDHSNIDRTYRALGVEGIEALNHLLLRKAKEEGFADPSRLSSDTTAQEAYMGYPNEPGILRQVAERVGRACQRIIKRGVPLGEKLFEKLKEVRHLVREHHLRAKTKEAKKEVLGQLVEKSERLMDAVVAALSQSRDSLEDAVVQKAVGRLAHCREFLLKLTPQIRHWLATGEVVAGKLLHPDLQDVKAIIRNKAGKKVEFGFKWLLNRIGGGYLIGRSYLTLPGESKMPQEAVALYQEVFGAEVVPEWFAYDRGGWSKTGVEKLQAMKIKKVGVVPKGEEEWLVEEADQATIATMRAEVEGSIGTLKSERYKFNRPKTRSTNTTLMAGQRACVSKNLSQFLSDLLQREASA